MSSSAQKRTKLCHLHGRESKLVISFCLRLGLSFLVLQDKFENLLRIYYEALNLNAVSTVQANMYVWACAPLRGPLILECSPSFYTVA